MPRYIEGFYVEEDDTHLGQIRKVYDALEDLYPWGGNEFVISEKSNVALGTCRGYLKEKKGDLARFTRKENRDKGTKLSGPGKNRFNVENHSFVLKKEKQFANAFSPGFVSYKQDFLDGWNKIIKKSEVDVIHESLVKLLKDIFTRMDSTANDLTVEKIEPRLGEVTTRQKVTETGDPSEMTKDMICNGCGINHEARDFIRAMLLHLVDLIEGNKKYIKFLSEKKFLNEDALNTFLDIAEGQPVKTQWGKLTSPGILYFKGEKIGKIKTLPDKPQIMLEYIHQKNPEKYERIVEQLIREEPSCISKSFKEGSRILPRLKDDNVHLRLKNSKAKDRIVAKIIKHAGYSKDDWQEIPTTK